MCSYSIFTHYRALRLCVSDYFEHLYKVLDPYAEHLHSSIRIRTVNIGQDLPTRILSSNSVAIRIFAVLFV